MELFGGLQALWHVRTEPGAPKDDPRLFETLRRLPETLRAIDDLQAWGILKDDIETSRIPDRYLGRLVTLWVMLDLVRR